MRNPEAQALAYTLEIGAVDAAGARRWADGQLLRIAEPPDELLALATEYSVPEAISLLHQLGTGAECATVGRLVYRHLLTAIESDTISHQGAAELVVRLASEKAAPCSAAENEAWRFDDAFHLVSDGYATRSEIDADLEAHLRKYAA